MKKWTAMLLTMSMVFALTACGGQDKEEKAADPGAETQTKEADVDTAEKDEEPEPEVPEEPQGPVTVEFSFEVYDGKIQVSGLMPENFIFVNRSEQTKEREAAEEKGEEFVPVYEFRSGYNALVGADFAIEFETSSYVYHTSVYYEEIYGETEPSFEAYKEWRAGAGDLVSESERTVREYTIGGRDAIAYIYSARPYIVIGLDDYSTPIMYYLNVYPTTELESRDEAVAFLDNEELNLILDSLVIEINN